MLEQCLADLGGIERFVRPGQMVVIKPNITANAPAASGGTTHVEIVEAIIRQVQRCAPGRILVAEGTLTFGTTLETAFPSGAGARWLPGWGSSLATSTAARTLR